MVRTQKPANTETQKSAQRRTRRSTERKSGLVVDVLDMNGKLVDKMKLPKEVFAADVNDKLLAQTVRVYLANQRQGTASTKTRGEVAGSTRKIYRQKGTGHARHGSIKAPIFIGGGIVFGPKPQDYSLKLPQKMKIKALWQTLTSKFNNQKILVIDSFRRFKPKTKEAIKTFRNLKLEIDKGKLSQPTLLITTAEDKNFILACRNIQNLSLTSVNLLNPYLILANEKIVLSKKALEILSSRWQNKS